MKKIFFFVAALAATVMVQAADKTWNFTTIFTEATSFAALDETNPQPEAIVDGELYTYGMTDKGFTVDVNQSPKYYDGFFGVEDQDANKKVARLKTGGTGAVTVNGDQVSVKGALAFQVAGNSTVKIAAISSSSSAVRIVKVVTKEGAVVATFDVAGDIGGKDAGTQPFVANYAGGPTTLYIFSAAVEEGDATHTAGGVNFYKVAATNVEAWGTTHETAVENVATEAKTLKVVENGQLVIIKNGVRYNALGARL